MVTDPALAPTRRRSKEIALKVAMCLALADFDPQLADTLVVSSQNVSAAQRLLEPTENTVLRVIERSYESQDTAGLSVIADYLKQVGTVTRPRLTLYATKRGIGATKLRDFVQTLQTTGQITMASAANHWVTYTWVKRKAGKP